jgi:putative endonuclease
VRSNPTSSPLSSLVNWVRARLRPASVPAGEQGEQWAADWLRTERGYGIVARNWRNPRDEREEIDLVARDGDVLVFVEVKARAAGALVPGYYAVNARKKRILRRAIKSYLARLPHRPPTFRFDVVEIIRPASGPGSQPEVLHFANVPLFTKHFH